MNESIRRILLEVTGDTADARAELTRLRLEAARADAQGVDMRPIVDVRAAEENVAELRRKLEALRAMDPTVQVDADIAAAEAQLNAFLADLQRVESGEATAKVDLNSTDAFLRIQRLRAALVDLDRQEVDPRIRIRVDQARAQLAEVENDMRRAAAAIANVDFGDPEDIRRNSAALQEYQRALRAVQNETASSERAIRRWSQGLIGDGDNLNRSFRGFIGTVKQLAPILSGLSLVIFASLIPAMVGLGASAASAVAGLLALIPAAGAIGAALGGGLVAVFKSVGQVMDLRKRKQQAVDSQTRQNAQRDDELASAGRVLAESQRAVRDAYQQRESASEALARAEQAAAEGIRDAQNAARDAAKSLRQATTDAYRAMRDAATDAKNAVLGLRDAQLSVQESELDLKDAERALRDFARAGGSAMADLGRKFEDVSFNPKGLREAVRNARGTGAVGEDAAAELERLTIAVERARLRQQQATQGVTNAQQELSDARKTEADFARRGIAAYEPYTQAVQANTEAQRDLARVTREGIAGNAGVIAAQNQLRDANERIVESEQRVKDAIRSRGDVMRGDVTGPMALYEAELKELTRGQRDLYDALEESGNPLKKFRDAIADPVLSAAADVIRDMKGELGGVMGWASQLGNVGAKNLRDFVTAAKADPKNAQAMKVLGDESLRAGEIIGGPLLRNAVAVLRNFAAALAPLVNLGLQKLADAMGRLAQRTNDWATLRAKIEPMLRLVGDFAQVIRQAIGAFVDLGSTTESVFGPILGWISDGIKKFREFMDTPAGGDRIRQFFEDTAPLLKSTITNLVKLGIVLMQAFQFAAPVIAPVSQLFGMVLSLIIGIMEVLLKIPAGARAILSIFVPITGVIGLIGKLFSLLGRIPGVAGLVARFFTTAIGGMVRSVVAIFRGFISHLDLVVRTAAAIIRVPFNLLRGFFVALVRGIVYSFTEGWDGIKSVFSAVGGFFEDAFGGIVGVVTGIFDTIVGVAKGAVNFLIKAVNVLIGALNAIPDIPTPFGDIGIPDIDKIPELAKGGVTSGSTLAMIGEAGKEAVIPLKGAVLRQIGLAIAQATPRLPGGRSGPAAGGGGGGGVVIENLNISSPPGTNPDLVNASKKLGRAIAGAI